MKIVHVIPTMGCGGAEILLSNLALHQKRFGHQVEIVMLYPHHYTFKNFPNHDVLVKEIPITIISSRVKMFPWQKRNFFLHDWKEFITSFKPDVIHSHIYEADLIAHSVILSQVAYFTHIHGPVSQLEPTHFLPRNKDELYKRFEKRWCHQHYLRCDTHFIAISKDIFNYTKTLIPSALHSNIHLLNNAIEIKDFPFRERHPSSPVKLVTTGNLVAKKNHEFLVKVIDYLQKSGANCQLDILGFGEEEEALNQLIRKLNLEDKIYLRGSVSNVKDYLLNADLYLHAAQPEPFGIAILEAMATGLPVVTLNGGGNHDFVFNGVNGFILEEKNVTSFAEKIIALMNDQTLYNRFSIEARKTSLNFDMVNYSSRVLDIYQDVLSALREKI